MQLKGFLRSAVSGRGISFLRLAGPMNQFFRLSFLSTLIAEGIHARLAGGPVPLDALLEDFGGPANREALASFLRMGVELKELRLGPGGYSLRGRLSKALVKPENDALAALLHEVVLLSHETLTRSPALMRQGKGFPFPERYGPLIARSSRVLEDLVGAVVDQVVPVRGPCRLLEVGCGCGVHIQRACRRNPALQAVGLELQEDVARFAQENMAAWGLDGRVEIRRVDVRAYRPAEPFDLVTLHNNIYYFPADARGELASRLKTMLRPGGRLVLTTGCQGGSPLMEYLNLHCIMTDGLAALPDPEPFADELRRAGYDPVVRTPLLPRRMDSFHAFVATRPQAGPARGPARAG